MIGVRLGYPKLYRHRDFPIGVAEGNTKHHQIVSWQFQSFCRTKEFRSDIPCNRHEFWRPWYHRQSDEVGSGFCRTPRRSQRLRPLRKTTHTSPGSVPFPADSTFGSSANKADFSLWLKWPVHESSGLWHEGGGDKSLADSS